MKLILEILFFCFIYCSIIFSQVELQILDSLDVPNTFEEPTYKVTGLELTGDFHELVICVGFPDV